MARSSCEGEQSTVDADERTTAQELDCLKDVDLFETMCKILNIPMEMKQIGARRRLMPWFRVNMTAWLYEYAKRHMSKHSRVYRAYQLDIGLGAFKQVFDHRIEKDVQSKCVRRERKRRNVEGRPGRKLRVFFQHSK